MKNASADNLALTVNVAADWAAVNEALMEFEDGTVKEVWFDTHRWVGDDDLMREEGLPDVIVIVQFQTAPTRSARFRFTGVRSFVFDQSLEVIPATAETVRDGWEAAFLSCRVRASNCVVELRNDELLGPGPFLRS